MSFHSYSFYIYSFLLFPLLLKIPSPAPLPNPFTCLSFSLCLPNFSRQLPPSICPLTKASAGDRPGDPQQTTTCIVPAFFFLPTVLSRRSPKNPTRHANYFFCFSPLASLRILYCKDSPLDTTFAKDTPRKQSAILDSGHTCLSRLLGVSNNASRFPRAAVTPLLLFFYTANMFPSQTVMSS